MNGLLETLLAAPRIGEIFSIASALIWAVAVILFRIVGGKVHPLGMNFFKNALALGLFVLSLAVLGQPLFPPLPWTRYALYFLSGTLGIALSDWLFFTTLMKLGAELTAIVDCAYSPFVIGLSFLFLGERMNALQVAGVVLIVAAVLMITGRKADARIAKRDLFSGVAGGVLAMLLTAVGIVIIKPTLNGVPLVWAAFVRMAGGAAASGLLLAVHPRRREIVRPLRTGAKRGMLVIAAVLSSYFSVLVWMAGFTYTQASIASALNQINTIFIFLLAALFLKEKITPLKLAAVILAFGGALLVSIPL